MAKPGNHTKKAQASPRSEAIRLNRYIAHCGVCSRRDADELIRKGRIRVNGKVVTEMGFKVEQGDKVHNGSKLLSKENFVYVLLNKPKDFITTTNDPQERKTVMDLVKKAGDERLFPVGRLDRNTTGLLVLTNDGDLAEKLSHPSHEVKKIYKIVLNKPITKHDFATIIKGFSLDDGPVKVDDLAVLSEDRKEIGLELHLGRNRIVRRIFENFGYRIDTLDRVVYAGLDKLNLPRGKWRFLNGREVGLLKKRRK